MKTLFLVSSFQDMANTFETLFKDTLKEKTITFIPTASHVESVRFYVKTAKKAFEKMGFQIELLDISTADLKTIQETLQRNESIYISGGNTFYLLQELRRSGADNIILQEVNQGKLYIGESAGAVITGTTIEFVQKMDSIKKAPTLNDFTGLGLTTFNTLPHYESIPFQKITKKIFEEYQEKFSLVPIHNKQAILVNQGDGSSGTIIDQGDGSSGLIRKDNNNDSIF